MANNQLTPNDEELIDLAYSTTYRSSIRKMMEKLTHPNAVKSSKAYWMTLRWNGRTNYYLMKI